MYVAHLLPQWEAGFLKIVYSADILKTKMFCSFGDAYIWRHHTFTQKYYCYPLWLRCIDVLL